MNVIPGRQMNRRICFPTVALAMLLTALVAAAPAVAHVALDAPNGGETLEVGSVHTIQWHDSVTHGPANYDLWYSATGEGGPWIEIAADLFPDEPMSSYSYEWTIPDTPSGRVRVRVRQDNSDTDYEDISDGDLTITESTGGNEVVLDAAHDATLYEGDGSVANGSGSYFFTGATESQAGAAERRALVAFDIGSAVPPGSRITEVTLELNMSRTISGNQTVNLHSVLESWGEGPSDPTGQEGGGAAAEDGDTTWVHRTYPSNMWSSDGGAYTASTSGSALIGGTGPYAFDSTSVMVADVQGWLDDPSSNHGWALVIPSPPTGSAKRFDSRENGNSANRPRLRINYEGGAMPVASRVFIPAVAQAAGANGSFFITTVDVHNRGSSTATVNFEWLPRNTDNTTPIMSNDYTLEPGETRRFGEFLDEVFGLSDVVGAASVVSGTDGIEVMSRTFNQGAEGTFGQSLPGVSEREMIFVDTRALILFLTENAALRSNLGLVNGVDMPITVRWELFASDGSSLGTGSTTLPPWGNKQLNRVLEDFAPIEAAYAHVWTTTPDGAFTCYGSVLDNQTSDPTTILAD